MGSLGSGYAAKLINNLIVGGEITLIAEAIRNLWKSPSVSSADITA